MMRVDSVRLPVLGQPSPPHRLPCLTTSAAPSSSSLPSFGSACRPRPAHAPQHQHGHQHPHEHQHEHQRHHHPHHDLPSYFSSRGVDLAALALAHAVRSHTQAQMHMPMHMHMPQTSLLPPARSAHKPSPASSSSWARAPEDILTLVFQCLPFPTILACQHVNHAWSSAARDPLAWQHTSWNRSVDDTALQRISRHLPYLRTVSLPNSAITVASIPSLLALPHLTALNLQSCNRLRADALRALLDVTSSSSVSSPSSVSSSLPSRLVSLDLHDMMHVNDALVPWLAQLGNLTSLHLGATNLSSNGFATLFSTLRVRRAVSLSSSSQTLPSSSSSSSSSSPLALLSTPLLPTTISAPLRRLDLTRSKIGDDGLLALGTCLPQLTHLTLDDCDQVTEDGVHHVGMLTSLRHLSLIAPHLSPFSLLALSSLHQLEFLSLGALCNDDVLRSLSTCFPRLAHLSIPCSPVTVRSLVSLSSLSRLHHLHIAGCERVSDTAKEALFQRSRWGTFYHDESRAEWFQFIERECEEETRRELLRAKAAMERAQQPQPQQHQREHQQQQEQQQQQQQQREHAARAGPAPSHFPLHGYWQPCIRVATTDREEAGSVQSRDHINQPASCDLAWLPSCAPSSSSCSSTRSESFDTTSSVDMEMALKRDFDGMGEDWMRTPASAVPQRKRSSPSSSVSPLRSAFTSASSSSSSSRLSSPVLSKPPRLLLPLPHS